ncbi:MAG TPA: ABC transporter ATP-binding protein [bacterium]|nr:ABC transporter ATP-binding protein [bacterium]
MTAMIEINSLSFSYPDGRRALWEVSLSVGEGERVALIGPNGAGKSTLLLHMNGILRGEGEVRVDGLKLSRETLPEIRRRVGLVFQDPNDQLFCPTVADDVAFGPMHFGLAREELDRKVADSLSAVGMGDAAGRPAHHLSVGERRRVTLAAVLACDPKVLALDEPAAMLDPRRRRWLTEFLVGQGRTVVLATHDLDFALATCKRAVLMHGGRVVADGETRAILGDRQLLSSHDL